MPYLVKFDMIFALMRQATMALLVPCLVIPAPEGRAATYHVNEKIGHDDRTAEAAQNLETPWGTIQKASDNASPGDTIRVHAGDYPERVVISGNGRVGDGRITYIAENGVTVRGFEMRGNFNRIIGFEITHPSNLFHEGIRVSGANGVEILDNNLHNLSESGAGSGITYGNCNRLIIRGNRISFTGSPGNDNGPGAKSIGEIFNQNLSSGVLIEYNTIQHTTDYLTPAGNQHIYRNNILGPTSDADFGGAAHTDGYQSNAGTTDSFMENNWHVDNTGCDSHLYLDEVPGNHHITMLRNVSVRSGDRLNVQWRVSTHHLNAHATIAEVGVAARFGGPGSDGAFYIWDGSTNNVSRNNIFFKVTTGSSPYSYSRGGTAVTDHDLSYPHGYAAVTKDPRFVDYPTLDLNLKPDSPAINAAGPLTSTVGSGQSANVVKVENSRWFHDGLGIADGHIIYIGKNNNLHVTAVDWIGGTITVAEKITWENGADVGLAYLGSGPDIGAFEFRENGYKLEPTYLDQGNGTASVKVSPEIARQIIVYSSDGIPSEPIFVHSDTTPVPYHSGDTIRVYSRYPSSSLTANATPSR